MNQERINGILLYVQPPKCIQQNNKHTHHSIFPNNLPHNSFSSCNILCISRQDWNHPENCWLASTVTCRKSMSPACPKRQGRDDPLPFLCYTSHANNAQLTLRKKKKMCHLEWQAFWRIWLAIWWNGMHTNRVHGKNDPRSSYRTPVLKKIRCFQAKKNGTKTQNCLLMRKHSL